MTSTVIIGLSGSLNRPSRTRALVETAVSRAASRIKARSVVVDLLDLGPDLGTARRLSDLSAVARGTVDAIIGADALVVASPVYKGSYTGLFKHLIDLIDPLALVGKPVLLAATGGGDRHALVVEHQLRPLFAFFEAATLATGIYASEKEIDYDGTVSPGLSDRLDRAVAQFEPHLGARATEPRSPRTLPPARSSEPIAAAASA
ncbi:FMN reductase [Mongoliimonas terrestris]|uniref:FMN reductase n=1 Tax=Mongoliimonas terrestris TaxID=1709001 RepID=UPI00094991FF|nr:FMN reductase [Mongoliimonas terrestris]